MHLHSRSSRTSRPIQPWRPRTPCTYTHSNRNGLTERVALGRRGLDGLGVVREQRAGRQSVVLVGEGGAVASAVVRRAFPCGDGQDLNVRAPRDGPGWSPVVGIRRAFPCVGFDARMAVVLRSFPCRDDEDLNLRAPRDGPGNGATRHDESLLGLDPPRTLQRGKMRSVGGPGLGFWSRLVKWRSILTPSDLQGKVRDFRPFLWTLPEERSKAQIYPCDSMSVTFSVAFITC
jgi:hypothetical protein